MTDAVRRGRLQPLIALSQMANTLIGGWADESLSARAYRRAGASRVWAAARRVIDAVLGRGHCAEAYLSERERAQLPPEYRT